MSKDLWHYARKNLAKQILGMFESGLSSALVLFAPRRMGKTEFLCKDVIPLAEKQAWKVFYFSFLDVGHAATLEFTKALSEFANKPNIFKRINQLSLKILGVKAAISLNDVKQASDSMKNILMGLAKKEKTLLLLDEIQVLAQYKENENFIAALRTVLDLNKDRIKVIFTGSSQEGLRRMFSQAKAPFFHFGQNLPFPTLDRGFTDHLAKIFNQVTQRSLDEKLLWQFFEEMQMVPQLARALVERAALYPDLSLSAAKNTLLKEIFESRAFAEVWDQCAVLERLLLNSIVENGTALFSENARKDYAARLGVPQLGIPAIQSSLRVLQRKGLIAKHVVRGGYVIEDLNFRQWLLQEKCL